MVKSLKTQIIFRSIFLVFALFGVITSFGVLQGKYNPDFYLYFTNISNYLCFFVVIALLVDNAKKYSKGEREDLTEFAPNFRLSVFVMIFITFLVYNTILDHPFKVSYWTNIRSIVVHLICPVLFMVDYMLFSKHRTVSKKAPFLALIIPVVYFLYIVIRAEVYVGTGKMVYPYFFLNGYELGWGVVALYLLAIAVIIVGVGFALWAYDKLVKNEENKLVWDFSPLPKSENLEPQRAESLEDSGEEKSEETKEDTVVEEIKETKQDDENTEEKPKRERKKKSE